MHRTVLFLLNEQVPLFRSAGLKGLGADTIRSTASCAVMYVAFSGNAKELRC